MHNFHVQRDESGLPVRVALHNFGPCRSMAYAWVENGEIVCSGIGGTACAQHLGDLLDQFTVATPEQVHHEVGTSGQSTLPVGELSACPTEQGHQQPA